MKGVPRRYDYDESPDRKQYERHPHLRVGRVSCLLRIGRGHLVCFLPEISTTGKVTGHIRNTSEISRRAYFRSLGVAPFKAREWGNHSHTMDMIAHHPAKIHHPTTTLHRTVVVKLMALLQALEYLAGRHNCKYRPVETY